MPDARSTESLGRGVKSSIPIVIGYLPAAIAFGLLASDTGLSLWMSVVISITTFAGASQFMALNLFQAGASAAEIAFSTLLVNLRHVMMSSSLAPRLKRTRLLPLLAFGVTDETYAVASTQKEIDAWFMAGLELPSYASWVIGTGLGHLLGQAVPSAIGQAFGVSLYAMFIALLVPDAIGSVRIAVVALAAGAINTALEIAGLWASGVNLAIAILVGAFVGLSLQAPTQAVGL